jgi:23S rRNA pseudouridine1911/1915/1917 synthase
MECAPRTGRTHQIRLHLAHAGHPIVGDDIYGIQGPWIGRQALHAAVLEVPRLLKGVLERVLPHDAQKSCFMPS